MCRKKPDVFQFVDKIEVFQTETDRLLVQRVRIRVYKKYNNVTNQLKNLKKSLNGASHIDDDILIKHSAACGLQFVKRCNNIVLLIFYIILYHLQV